MSLPTRGAAPPPGSAWPVPQVGPDGVVPAAPTDEHSGLDESLTPTGAAGLLVAMSRLVELQRTITPVVRGAVEAQTGRDRARAAAWDAAAQVLRSKWALPGFLMLSGALALAGLELVGFEMSDLPAIIGAVRQCPVDADPGGGG